MLWSYKLTTVSYSSFKARRIPFAKINAENKSLEAAGIISPASHLDWVASIIKQYAGLFKYNTLPFRVSAAPAIL